MLPCSLSASTGNLPVTVKIQQSRCNLARPCPLRGRLPTVPEAIAVESQVKCEQAARDGRRLGAGDALAEPVDPCLESLLANTGRDRGPAAPSLPALEISWSPAQSFPV